MSHYSACQIKFAFDVSRESPLAWHEYFGWDDEFDMLADFVEHNLKSDSLSFYGVDTSGAKCTVVFETVIEPEGFNSDYQLALGLLAKLSKDPNYNKCPELFNSMLDCLDEEGITIYTDQLDIEVFYAYNKINQGFQTYQEHLDNINAKQLKI